MTEMTDYKNAPAELKAAAEEIASTYDFDRAVLSGAILAALVAERERCASVAARIRQECAEDAEREAGIRKQASSAQAFVANRIESAIRAGGAAQ